MRSPMYRCSTVPPVYLRCSVLLALQRLERVVGEADRQLRRVRVVRRISSVPACRMSGKRLLVLLGEAVGGAFGRRRLEVVQVAGLFLEAHACARARGRAAQRQARGRQASVMSSRVAGEVADHLVDAVHADGGEMVAQRAEVALGVGEQPVVDVALDHLALDLQALSAPARAGRRRARRAPPRRR